MKNKKLYYVIGGVVAVGVVALATLGSSGKFFSGNSTSVNPFVKNGSVLTVASPSSSSTSNKLFTKPSAPTPKEPTPVPSTITVTPIPINPQTPLTTNATNIAAFNIAAKNGPVIFDNGRNNKIVVDYTFGGVDNFDRGSQYTACVLNSGGINYAQAYDPDITQDSTTTSGSGTYSRGKITFTYFLNTLKIDANTSKDFTVQCAGINLATGSNHTLGTYFIKNNDPINWGDAINSNYTNQENQYMPIGDMTLGFLKQ